MTSEVTIGYPYATPTVWAVLTDLGVSVSHTYSNPLILVPTPMSDIVGASGVGWNIIAINIGFVANRYAIRFTITDGIGTLKNDGTGTIYEKLNYMANNFNTKNAKALTINGTKIGVHIESFNVTFAAGDKDLALNCSLNLIGVNPTIDMG